MSRTEGFNQPDLLNILRKQGGQAPAPRPPAESPAIPKTPAPPLPHALSAAPGRSPSRPRRISKRDVLIIAALAAVVAGLVLAIAFRRKGAPPAGGAVRPAATRILKTAPRRLADAMRVEHLVDADRTSLDLPRYALATPLVANAQMPRVLTD